MILGIYGTHGAGREIHELAHDILATSASTPWDDVVFIDDFTEETILYDSEICSFTTFCERFGTDEAELVIAVGEPSIREELYERVVAAGFPLATLIHPLASISPHASIGEGVCIRIGSIVCADAIVDDNVCINSLAIVGHDAHVGRHTQISAYAHISGNVAVGERCYLGVMSSIRDECQLGSDVVLGMGAMVMEQEIPSNVMAVGNPAKYVRRKAGSKVFS